MTSLPPAARVLALILALTLTLMGAEYVAFTALRALRGLAATRRFLLFFAISISVVCVWHFLSDDEADEDEGLFHDLDDDAVSTTSLESEDARSKAPSRSLSSRGRPSLVHDYLPTVPRAPYTSPLPTSFSPQYTTPPPIYMISPPYSHTNLAPSYSFTARFASLSSYNQPTTSKPPPLKPSDYVCPGRARTNVSRDPYAHLRSRDERFRVCTGLLFPDAVPMATLLPSDSVSVLHPRPVVDDPEEADIPRSTVPEVFARGAVDAYAFDGGHSSPDFVPVPAAWSYLQSEVPIPDSDAYPHWMPAFASPLSPSPPPLQRSAYGQDQGAASSAPRQKIARPRPRRGRPTAPPPRKWN
ncbi:hypothetical protein FB45DRAFT_232684 [Roridomyces roridus]|uniref:Uncharacterized protein n=1 Tax=Roridomyces roridus TaxID=1738132 RepID=A0AAD7F7G5_9AGAR|nr:hypothetical protein FB45DRAFT_232684 [Roridomyces roridus]